MAPSTATVDDFTFLMTCVKHSEIKIKPNFEEVAKETGSKNGNVWYVPTPAAATIPQSVPPLIDGFRRCFFHLRMQQMLTRHSSFLVTIGIGAS